MQNGNVNRLARIIMCGLAVLCAPFLPFANTAAADTTVLMFIIDGLQDDTARFAASHGALNLKFLMDNGVRVEDAYSTSPAPRMSYPGTTMPWGTTTSANVAMHTGTHVFESKNMDDIFTVARRAGIKSVFAGGAGNYSALDTADFSYYGGLADTTVVRHGLDHVRKDGARLIRLHLQQIRRGWTGPADKTVAGSPYQRAVLHADSLLGVFIAAIKAEGVWDSTCIVVSSDHGMGTTAQSDHSPSQASSWQPVMLFYGPGVKKGATIPYAETPDIALMAAYFLHLPPLRGHLDPATAVAPKGTTGTFLANILVGGPKDVKHPRMIRRYLESKNWKAGNDYAEYREAMMGMMREFKR